MRKGRTSVWNGFENMGVSDDGIFPISDTSSLEGYVLADWLFALSRHKGQCGNAVQSLVNDRTFPNLLMSHSYCLSFRDFSIAFTDNLADLAHILIALGVRSASKQKQKEAMEKIKALVTENCRRKCRKLFSPVFGGLSVSVRPWHGINNHWSWIHVSAHCAHVRIRILIRTDTV